MLRKLVRRYGTVHTNTQVHTKKGRGERENQCKAIFMGVVRQAVNTSAGNSALCGRV
jgi:hypothetical protein